MNYLKSKIDSFTSTLRKYDPLLNVALIIVLLIDIALDLSKL